MAVYTDVTDQDLDAFLADYALGAVLSFKGIAEGVSNSNFSLETEAGRFILTLYEARADERDLPFFIALMEHWAAGGIRCPQPVPARDGRVLGRLNNRPAAIVTFLEGVSVRRPNADHCADLGRALAGLHLAGRGFGHRRTNALGPGGWPPLVEQALARADTVSPGLAALVTDELAHVMPRWPNENALPAGVIHADLFPDNVFFLRGRFSGIIDPYFACNDLFAYDVAICLNAWCFEPDLQYNQTKARALIAGYEGVRALEPAEVEALPLLVRGAAFRFLLTRLVDWLNVPTGALVKPLDPMAYVKRLRTHRNIASAAEYGVLR